MSDTGCPQADWIDVIEVDECSGKSCKTKSEKSGSKCKSSDPDCVKSCKSSDLSCLEK